MFSFSQATVAAAVLLGPVQHCPAPFVAIPVVISIEMGLVASWVWAVGGLAGSAGTIAGAIEGAKKGKMRKTRDVINGRIRRQDYSTALAWQPSRRSNHDPWRQANRRSSTCRPVRPPVKVKLGGLLCSSTRNQALHVTERSPLKFI